MTKRKSTLVSTALVAGGLLWSLFRPGALVSRRTVNEPFPAAEESGSMMHGSSTMNQSPQMAHAAMDSSAMGAMDHGQMADAKEPVKLVSGDRKSTRLNSSHSQISYAVFCLKKKTNATT